MSENKFDKFVKNNLDEQIKAPEKLKNRIRQEIRQVDDKKKKTLFAKTIKGIAAVVVVGILSVTSYAAVTGNLNLQNMGFLKASKNYSQNAVEVNKEIENEYLKYTLNNIACDDTYLITESTVYLKDLAIEEYGDVEYDEQIKNYTISLDSNQFVNNKRIYCWGSDIQKVGDREYKFFELYNISDVKENKIKFESDILGIKIDNENKEKNQEEQNIENEDDIFTTVNEVSIYKEISMNIERKGNSKGGFEEVSQTIGNKTIVVREAANTNFSTIIKASIITDESYEQYLKNKETDSDYNNFMVTQEDGNDISYEVHEDFDTYVITDDGSIFNEDDLYIYMQNQKNENEETTSTSEGESEITQKSEIMDYGQIVQKYGRNEDLEKKVVKIQKNYIIRIGDKESGEDVKQVKLLPVKKEFINDRNDEEYEYYSKAKWYKLENKRYVATSELGGTLEITGIDITDDEIIFNYSTKGLIGEDCLILMRNNNGEFNYFYPDKMEEKGLSSNENRVIFYRTNNQSACAVNYNIAIEDEADLLNDISKDEFTMLFGKKNGTQFIGEGLVFNIPDKITDKVNIENIEVKDISDNWYEKGENDNSIFEKIDSNTSNDNLIAENTIPEENEYITSDEETFSLEQYNKLLNDTKTSIEKINTNGSKMTKDTASLSGIKIGSTIEEVHNIINEKAEETSEVDGMYLEYYTDDIVVGYQKKNDKYYVDSISTRGRLKTDKNIKIGDNVKKVIQSYMKDESLININENQYSNGWILYGNKNAANIKNDVGYITNEEGGQNAYYLLNSYSSDYLEEDYKRVELLYFDGDVCMEYYIEDGIVCEIILSVKDGVNDY